jgi:predicted RNA binding protein YcfA (HicA-like mRNA interferase family)
MARLPNVTGTQVVVALRRDGWYEVRSRGSHFYFQHAGRPGTVTVAVHAGAILKPKTLRSILQQASLSVEDFERLL